MAKKDKKRQKSPATGHASTSTATTGLSPPNSSDAQGGEMEMEAVGPSSSAPAAAIERYRTTGLGTFKEGVCRRFRVIVSQNRRRFRVDGYDLDLTYITDRIIAMGYPARATEAWYRNSMITVRHFLENRHKGHYKVFNLRGQYTYDPQNFEGRVISFEMTDHHPPRLELMAPFCREVHEWLHADPENVVAVHCKAGKGRTGVMICAYLIYCMFYPSPRQNMDYYSVVRTHNNKGVTIPSQRRYIYYYNHLRNHHLNYFPRRVQLVGIYIERPNRNKGTCLGPLLRDQYSMRVSNGDVVVYDGDNMNISDETWDEEEAAWAANAVSLGADSYDPHKPVEGQDVISRRAYGWTVPTMQPVFLEGDVRVDLYINRLFISLFPPSTKAKLGHVWFNTMFCCPSACGGTPYIHGDEAYPYPDGETTIAERKNKQTTSTSSVDAPSTSQAPTTSQQSAVHESEQTASVPDTAPLNETVISVPEVADNSGAVTGETTKISSEEPGPPVSPLQSVKSPDVGKQKSSKLSKAGKAAKKSQKSSVFATSEAKSATGEGLTRVYNLPSARHEPKKNAVSSELEPLTGIEVLEICEPPGLDEHCNKESITQIYTKYQRAAPRYAIDKMLADAHQADLVTDVYNIRRLSVPHEGEAVRCASDGRPEAGGPNRIVRKPYEHVQVFPIMEIDRAYKSENMHDGFKLIVVTKCVSNAMRRHAETFTEITFAKQKEKDENKFVKLHREHAESERQRSKNNLDTVGGASAAYPPLLNYGDKSAPGGGEAPTLDDFAYTYDERSRDPRYCKFFHKQRRDSISVYNDDPECPMTQVIPEEELPEIEVQRTEFRSANTSATRLTDEVRLARMDDADVANDVRRYHPDTLNLDGSLSSRSSTNSSDDLLAAAQTDLSGVDSSLNDPPTNGAGPDNSDAPSSPNI